MQPALHQVSHAVCLAVQCTCGQPGCHLPSHLDDLKLHPLIGLHSDEAPADQVDDPVNQALVRIVRVRLVATHGSIGNEFL